MDKINQLIYFNLIKSILSSRFNVYKILLQHGQTDLFIYQDCFRITRCKIRKTRTLFSDILTIHIKYILNIIIKTLQVKKKLEALFKICIIISQNKVSLLLV